MDMLAMLLNAGLHAFETWAWDDAVIDAHLGIWGLVRDGGLLMIASLAGGLLVHRRRSRG